MEDNQKTLLLDWMRKIHQLEYAHRIESVKWNNRSYSLGIPAIIVSAIIAAVSNISQIDDIIKNSILSAAGVLVAILTGLQTFLKPHEHCEKHKVISSTYEKIRHKIEYVLQFESDSGKAKKEIEKIKSEWESIESLNVSY